jgi:hypothetical protein
MDKYKKEDIVYSHQFEDGFECHIDKDGIIWYKNTNGPYQRPGLKICYDLIKYRNPNVADHVLSLSCAIQGDEYIINKAAKCYSLDYDLRENIAKVISQYSKNEILMKYKEERAAKQAKESEIAQELKIAHKIFMEKHKQNIINLLRESEDRISEIINNHDLHYLTSMFSKKLFEIFNFDEKNKWLNNVKQRMGREFYLSVIECYVLGSETYIES